MMNRTEFFEYIKENVKGYLPPALEEAKITIKEHKKEDGRRFHLLAIQASENGDTEFICLEGFYKYYQEGKDLEACVGDIADVYIEYGGQDQLEDVMDYEEIRKRLMVNLVDLEDGQEYLADKVYTVHGDFAAVYAVRLYEDGDGCISTSVTELQMKIWGISPEQLHQDAILADKARIPVLRDMYMLMMSEMYAVGGIANLLTEETPYQPMVIPMLCLTNQFNRNGASLILHEDILKRAGEVLGSNYYILPSSVHEVVIVPDTGKQDPEELSLMVSEINEEKVAPDERLSDKVQYYDRKTAVLENAKKRTRRLSSPREKYEIKYVEMTLDDRKTKEETNEAAAPLGKGEDVEKGGKLLPTV